MIPGTAVATRPAYPWRTGATTDADSPLLARCLASRWVGPALLASICFVAFFLGLGASHLFDPDEGRSAEVAREMLVSGHWVVPTIGFEQFDKPAFYYWTIAGSIELFGATDFAVRLPGALAAACTVLATGAWAMRYLGRSTGLLAALVLATTLGFIGMGRFVLTDATFSWWMIAALFYGGAWLMEGERTRWPIWPLYVCVALATLTKGPVAPVLAVLVLGPFAWRAARPTSLRALRPLSGALILLTVAGTWYAMASVEAPGYVWNFLWNHNVRRYAEGGGGHSANVFTFLYLLPAAYLPWSLYFPTTIATLVRSSRSTPLRRPLLFCAIWVVAVVGFFSLSGCKLVTYVLPAFPPLAVLVASTLSIVTTHDRDAEIPTWTHRAVLSALLVLSLAGAVALAVFFAQMLPAKLPLAALPLTAVPPLIYGWRRVTAGRHSAAIAAVAAFTLVNASLYYLAVAPALNEVYSYEQPAHLVRSSPEDVALYTYKASAYSLEYYAERLTHELKTPEDIARALAGTDPVVLVTRNRHLPAIRRAITPTTPMNVWWQGPRSRVMVSNRPRP